MISSLPPFVDVFDPEAIRLSQLKEELKDTKIKKIIREIDAVEKFLTTINDTGEPMQSKDYNLLMSALEDLKNSVKECIEN